MRELGLNVLRLTWADVVGDRPKPPAASTNVVSTTMRWSR